jgi:imidazolonepropionase-like amidohydrolase
MSKSFPCAPWLVLTLAWLAISPATAQVKPRAQLHVVRDVRLSDGEDAVRRSIVLRDGRIESITGADAPIPPGARVIEADGALALPAFIDAYTHTGTETPTPEATQDKPVSTSSDVRVDMRQANRKGIEPAFRAIEALAFKEGKLEGYRGKGFGALLSAPHGQILSGTSVLVSSLDAAVRDVVIDSDVFAHAGLRASGGGYPSTMMGSIAQMRQFFLDAHHQRDLAQRREEGRPGPRAPFDEDLAAGMPLLLREQRVLCEADGARDIERWLKLSRELGLEIAISGGREAWKHADRLASRGVPVLLTLDWGDEVKDPHAKDKKKKKKGKPNVQAEEAAAPAEDEAQEEPTEPTETEPPEKKGDEDEDEGKADEDEERWTYIEPMAVREERRREWEETRDCAMRLSEAGVAFAFGSGSKSPADLLKSVRALVEAGLPAEVAIAGLTSGAADLLGVGRSLGRIAPGFDASIALWTENPTDKDAQLAWLFVDGFPYEFEVEPKDEKGAGDGPDEGIDATGTWTLSVESEGESRPMTASLEMSEEGVVTGTLTSTNPMDDSEVEADCTGSVSGNQLSLEASLSFGEFDMDVELTGEIDGDGFTGELLFKSPRGDSSRTAKGTRIPRDSSVGTEVRR